MTRTGLLALLGLALAGCQSLPPPVPDKAPAHRDLTVPFHPQERYQCGPAALAMMLGWAGHAEPPSALVGEVWLPERQGSLMMELQAAARARGLLVVPVDSADDLFAELDAGHPVLVMQNLALPFWPRWHFAVVKGYRDGGSTVLLHSGTDANRDSHWNRFIRTWSRARYRGFVALPAGQLPAAADSVELVRALDSLHQVAGRQAALSHWRAAVRKHPRDGLLQFGYGNLLWESGRKKEARDAFARAAQLNPERAAAWNNLAEAWLQTGCPQSALAPAQRARELQPDNNAVLDTLERVKRAQGEPGTACPSDAPAAGASSG